jgi:3-oxoacyl-[acyl-carrier protein] reductase
MARKPTHKRSDNGAPRVAVVTGGGTGLGRDAANRLTRDGFKVAVVGRRADRLKPRRGEVLHPYPCDVADPAAIRTTVREIVRDLGAIDVLVNSAGVIKREPLAKISQQTIAYQVDVNLMGTINMSLACVPALKKTKGAIINFSSEFSRRAAPGFLIYCMTKGGIDAFTRGLAVELGPYQINVNAISPGLVRSEIYFNDGAMTKAAYEKYLKTYGKMYPLGRAGEPEDVSELVSFLASGRASWMTGDVISVDGGGAAG